MLRARDVDAVVKRKFWFRVNEDNGSLGECKELTVDEIMNGEKVCEYEPFDSYYACMCSSTTRGYVCVVLSKLGTHHFHYLAISCRTVISRGLFP